MAQIWFERFIIIVAGCLMLLAINVLVLLGVKAFNLDNQKELDNVQCPCICETENVDYEEWE